MRISPTSRQNRRHGTVAVIVALCLTAVLGFVAISMDGGSLLTERRHAQATADAAAMAAATVLYQNYPKDNGRDPTNKALEAAQKCAAGNGYTDDKTTSVVTVNIPPTSGP